MLRRAVIVLAVVMAAYLGIGWLARRVAGRFLYHPPPATYQKLDGLRILRGSTGNNLALLWLPNPSAEYTLLYFHGNGCDLGMEKPFLDELRQRGYSVLAWDYPGYGASTGKPEEATLCADARRVYEYLRKDLVVPATRIVAYGRSLGGGVATDLAASETVGGLILECTFTSAYRVMTRHGIVPFDQYENERKLRAVHCPVFILHGRADTVVPSWHSEALYRAANEPKTLWLADGAQHYAVPDAVPAEYWERLQRFTASLPH